MLENNDAQPKLEDLKIETVFEDRVYERYAFTFTINGDEFKGHFHEDEILWLHPHPRQVLDDRQVDIIETAIQSTMRHHGISNKIKDIEVETVFEDRVYERHYFTLQVQGDEYEGFVHEGEIQWFHPQPHQKHEEDIISVMESEIHEKIAEHEQDSKYKN